MYDVKFMGIPGYTFVSNPVAVVLRLPLGPPALATHLPPLEPAGRGRREVPAPRNTLPEEESKILGTGITEAYKTRLFVVPAC